ncbi:MAG: endopeptidase La [Sphingomonadaceae bacterium]|uniref:endopeptidase La n=1 Tax=Thermaurantiacus sp. TaxID=2820283 RepID=UPI00298EFD17|nr:endopeptidase La [Thermaurantiacus sp.]MCS6986730.1 endopeptidase La [Sphingomonadaceae bacterium]MDW8414007.1 endopeptidase La [Thermaurantiacus sp.]
MMVKVPVLPLRDIVVFPHMVVPLFVGREKSVRALEAVMQGEKALFLLTQKNAADEDPGRDQLYDVGTIAAVVQLLKLPDGTVRVLVEGKGRARLVDLRLNQGYLEADVEPLADVPATGTEGLALQRSVLRQFDVYAKQARKASPELVQQLATMEDPGRIADTIAANLTLRIADRQALLAETDVAKRLELVLGYMETELGLIQVERKIKSRVKRQMEKTQREYYLNEQLKAIQRELGDDDESNEIAEYEAKIKKTKLSKEAREKAQAEVKKLKTMSPMSAEATVVRNWLDVLLSLPWGKVSKVKTDIVAAERILEADHYGLEKVKERIIEYLAVQARTSKLKGPILCLVGPPGVGKTSLGRSIAKATGREFVRVSLGGVRDEAEIRGHRRTYIGALPGKIIQNLRKAGTANPLFLLDEIDKLGQDFRGDPASALLEVLDPEQNSKFSDHYLEVDFDLSQVMFVTTANSLAMPQPLVDRMEIIQIPGYTEDEKVEIAKRHLVPKQMEAHGLKEGEFAVTDEAIRDIIRYYTREAGVRTLEREIAKLARKSLRRILEKKAESFTITPENLGEFLGVRKFRFGMSEAEDQVGAVTGLAWTPSGGDLLTIESVTVPGKGQVVQTGKLGDVMKESITAAFSFVKARSAAYGIDPEVFKTKDIHIHVPEGATPKDGPSAGIAMVTSIVSTLTGIAVRRDVAMTGEVTLRGRVLAVGGLKEKLLAALRGGISTVLIPAENEKDLAEIPDNVKQGLAIVPVGHVDEVLRHAFVRPLEPLPVTDPSARAAAPPPVEPPVTH